MYLSDRCKDKGLEKPAFSFLGNKRIFAIFFFQLKPWLDLFFPVFKVRTGNNTFYFSVKKEEEKGALISNEENTSFIQCKGHWILHSSEHQ